MRATITHFIETLKKRRSSDEGFSLIELIVVVAILGILVAIAIPVFGSIQETAKENAVATIAANGATQVASQVAASDKEIPADEMSFATLNTADITVSLTLPASGALTIDNYCVMAKQGATEKFSGPKCPAPAPGGEG